ncbi:chymotrypsin inhibitor [Onthophagus taurus]|uniref:chymotrypsin inhibitor n=1 Tax=Onthophagus taurus TaxID=166361 RepID=UPI000C20B0CC|nr:mucin-6-like [Onthophagus taurus]
MKVFVFVLVASFFVAALADDFIELPNTDGEELVVPEPVECPAGEVATDCYAHCQGTCENPYVACLPICTAGCICAEGELRNGDDGPCVAVSEC